MTLNDLEGHSSVAEIFKFSSSNTCDDDDDDDDDMTILMCAQKLTDTSLIYHT